MCIRKDLNQPRIPVEIWDFTGPSHHFLLVSNTMKEQKENRLYLESLGCARNLVDSENMLGHLLKSGYLITKDPKQADVIIVNTCGFIEPAINESIDTILALAEYKKKGICRKLIITGCLPERFRHEIVPALPEVDLFLGTGAFHEIVDAVNGVQAFSECSFPDPDTAKIQGPDEPRELTSSISVYLKIAEGCSRQCTYCIIPRLRGRQKSRSAEDIAAEALTLISSGFRELVLIAQDTTFYGNDLKEGKGLGQLLDMLSGLSEKTWIRFLYGHPESIDDTVIKTVANRQNVCSYFDLPVQHASDPVLKKMGRKYTHGDLYNLFRKIRNSVPDAVLRSTMIVGFPGETEEDFEVLLDFVKDICFDHLGAFVYSDSKDLPAHKLAGHVSEQVARERFDRLMSCQLEISLKNNQKHVGKVYQVLVEENPEENVFIGRTMFQAPEVDGITYIHSAQPVVGEFAGVKITDAYEYDLYGEIE